MKIWAMAAPCCALLLSGCAVAMAANTRGVSMDQVAACQTRSCYLGLRDTTIVGTKTAEDGTVTETYRIMMRKGSVGRAFMHGALDLASFGVWEAIGTPVEGALGDARYVVVTGKFDPSGKAISATLGDHAST